MRGQVKWFNKEKGFGYVVSEAGVEHFVNVRAVVGADLPSNGDEVSFTSEEGRKGPRAANVVIERRALAEQSPNDKFVKCRNTDCGRQIVPRLIVSNGKVLKSVCPFCNTVQQYHSGCFIATAVYADPYAQEVVELRRFRDEVLLKTTVGTWVVQVYYATSPAIARHLAPRPRLRALIKPILGLLAKTQR